MAPLLLGNGNEMESIPTTDLSRKLPQVEQQHAQEANSVSHSFCDSSKSMLFHKLRYGTILVILLSSMRNIKPGVIPPPILKISVLLCLWRKALRVFARHCKRRKCLKISHANGSCTLSRNNRLPKKQWLSASYCLLCSVYRQPIN